jgi:hypothetical protein
MCGSPTHTVRLLEGTDLCLRKTEARMMCRAIAWPQSPPPLSSVRSTHSQYPTGLHTLLQHLEYLLVRIQSRLTEFPSWLIPTVVFPSINMYAPVVLLNKRSFTAFSILFAVSRYCEATESPILSLMRAALRRAQTTIEFAPIWAPGVGPS